MEKLKLGHIELTPEELFEALESLPIHASIVDKDSNILWGNRIAKANFSDDLIGMKCYTAYHGRSDLCPDCLVQKTFKDGKIHRHKVQVTPPEGKPIYFSCSSAVFTRDRNGNISSVIELSRDITDLKEREKELESIAKIAGEREEKVLELKEEIKVLKNRISKKPIAENRR